MSVNVVFNSPRMIDRRKELRRRSTRYENLLWVYLRNKRLGYKFKRQYSVSNYVLDFYCTDLNLGIELDGRWHIENVEYDKYRTKYLSAWGVKVLKFWNSELDQNLNEVINKIKSYFPPSPEAGEGTPQERGG